MHIFKPIKVLEVELSQPILDVEGLERFEKLQVLVRLYGNPLGYVHLPLYNGRCSAEMLSRNIMDQFSWEIVQHLIQNGLSALPYFDELHISDLVNLPPPAIKYSSALVTVAVCTRDRTDELALCLDALCQLDYPRLELIVIDNAPETNATELLIKNNYPSIRYIQEPRPGLSWARNRAIVEASGEIIAFTDDDVVVDAGWVRALASVFAEDPEVMAVTGLVVPYELETKAQVLFELHGGFGKGFKRKTWRVTGTKVPWNLLGAGQFGTGANMAFRCSVFDHIGVFNPGLGAGTVTRGCEDLEIFFRTLKGGHTLIYEPNAMVRHRHRRDYSSLRSQLESDGIGLYSYFVYGATTFFNHRFSFLRLGIWWFVHGNLKRLWTSVKHPTQFPRDLILAELKGCFTGMNRYKKARRTAAIIEREFGSIPKRETGRPIINNIIYKHKEAVAVRTIDLSRSLELTDIKDYSIIHIYVTWKHRLLGCIKIENRQETIDANRLYEAIRSQLNFDLLRLKYSLDKDFVRGEFISAITRSYSRDDAASLTLYGLSSEVSVSIVVATYDRPEDLRQCLRSLMAQQTHRPVEIIVVDNHPASGLTPPVVAEFSGVLLVQESRRGLAYARNAGFTASSGDICVATDDDVTMPVDWLEKLLAPFARPDVMVVTGNVLPVELENRAQRLFESYGGLGRGFENKEVDGKWFESRRCAVPTWQLGATANAAFRSSIFLHPQIGLMEECLGPGMPSGVGEDTYLFYKVLKAGYTIRYQADAYVWHKHRSTMEALRRQIYNYSKGGVAYNLTTWLQDGDWRGLGRLVKEMPYLFYWRIKERVRGRSDYPLSMLWLEFRGYLAGPWAYWRSRQRVKREGKSKPYQLPKERIGIFPLTLNGSTKNNQEIKIDNYV